MISHMGGHVIGHVGGHVIDHVGGHVIGHAGGHVFVHVGGVVIDQLPRPFVTSRCPAPSHAVYFQSQRYYSHTNAHTHPYPPPPPTHTHRHRHRHWAYGVVASMFDFQRSDWGSNPGRGGKIS